MSIYDVPVETLQGEPTSLADHADKALLVVNVASRCGFTPQYEGLQALNDKYGDQGFSVIGVPCNQFKGQEPGSAEDIAQFCAVNFGVTFPLLAKTDVNGPDRHPLYALLTEAPDGHGNAGDVGWNFEKFLVAPGGEIVARYRTNIEPQAPEVIAAIEGVLPR
jgi:glutathione peroxidase